MGKFWSGLGNLEGYRYQPLPCSKLSHSLPSRTISLLRSHHQLPHTRLQLSVGNSPSCSAIWWTLPSFPANLIPKTTGTWYGRISRSVLRSSHDLPGTSPNSLGMGFSCILATPTPMKMILTEQYAQG